MGEEERKKEEEINRKEEMKTTVALITSLTLQQECVHAWYVRPSTQDLDTFLTKPQYFVGRRHRGWNWNYSSAPLCHQSITQNHLKFVENGFFIH